MTDAEALFLAGVRNDTGLRVEYDDREIRLVDDGARVRVCIQRSEMGLVWDVAEAVRRWAAEVLLFNAELAGGGEA
jgi:hypothetical protein